MLVPQRVRNPVPVKAALALLGVGNGACRAPLAPLGEHGQRLVRQRLDSVLRRDRELFAPLQSAFRAADTGRQADARELAGRSA